MLIRLLGLKNAIFGRFWRFFAYFLRGNGPKFFSGPKNFFSQKFEPKWFQIHLFELPNSFWPIMHYYLVMLKKSFFPIFPNNLGFHAKPPYRNALKKMCLPHFHAWEHLIP